MSSRPEHPVIPGRATALQLVAIMYVDLFQPYLADGNVCVEPVIKMKGSLPSTSDSAGNAAYRELPRREFIYAASHTLMRSVPAYMLTWMK